MEEENDPTNEHQHGNGENQGHGVFSFHSRRILLSQK